MTANMTAKLTAFIDVDKYKNLYSSSSVCG